MKSSILVDKTVNTLFLTFLTETAITPAQGPPF